MGRSSSWALLLCMVSIAACGGGGGGNTPPGMLDWTVIAFLDGDGDREWQATTNLAQLEQVDTAGSSVAIVAFLDRHPKPAGGGYFSAAIPTQGGTDWTDSRWGRVIFDGLPNSYATTMAPLDPAKPEVNVGHPWTLGTFITKAMASAPAQHYALIVYDHGSPYGVAFDQTDKDSISTSELGQILDAVPYLDVVVLDACDMQHVEVATEMVGDVGYVLASQKPRWAKPLGSDIYYDRAIGWLVQNPQASPEAFALRLLLEDHHAASKYNGNASVVDVGGIPALNAAIDTFAGAALQDATGLDWPVLAGLRSQATFFHANEYRDLREYFDAVRGAASLPAGIQSAAQSVYDLLDPVTGSVVIGKEGAGSGLSIVFFADAASIYWGYAANRFDFLDPQNAVGTRWLDFLRALPTPAPPWIVAALDGLRDVLPDGPPDAPDLGGQGVVSWVDSLLEDPSDVDFVKIEVPSGGDVALVLYAEAVGDPAGGARPLLTVYGPDGTTTLAEAEADADAVATVQNVVLSAGTHYLAVSVAGQDEGTGRYLLRCLFGDPSLVAPALEVSDAALEFGDVPAGEWTTRTLDLHNPGGSTLTVGGFALPEGSPFRAPFEEFLVPLRIPPGATARIRVGVQPEGPGDLAATLEIHSPDGVVEPALVELHAHAHAHAP